MSLGEDNKLVVQGPDTAAEELQARVLDRAFKEALDFKKQPVALLAFSPRLLEVRS
jgi:hypothetical protein